MAAGCFGGHVPGSTMSSPLDAVVSVLTRASREKVWDALINPDSIKQYMFGTTVTTGWREGAPITWKGEWEGKPYEDKGTVLRFEPEDTLSYSHFSSMGGLPDVPENHHTVTIHLTAEGKDTRITLTQENNKTQEAKAHSEKNWQMMLDALKKFLEMGAHAA
jgi:uncharacterized protein YndB with AHSA1/START domain